MISLKRNSNTIYFLIDMRDAAEILDYLRLLRERSEAAFDGFDVREERNIKISLFKSNSEDDGIIVAKNKIQMWLSNDAIEYAEFRLEEFIKLGHISPAELVEFSTLTGASRKKNVRSYLMEKHPSPHPPR